jgi:DNA-binding transcriptional LysR family regulator
MDTEWARTFLTVVATGSFVRSADRLHVTQSTVSARMRALEGQLGCRLFVRNKSGATLTPAGHQFHKHATTLVRTVDQARQDAGIAQGFRAVLTVGGRFALWVELLMKWLPHMRNLAPDVSLRAEIDVEAGLMARLVDRSMDIGVMYTPESRPGLTVEFLLEEQLVMVSSKSESSDSSEGYVYVDWGPEFHVKYSMSFPEFGTPALVVGIAWLGLQHILNDGGFGYFPMRLVGPYLATGQLFQVEHAPTFALPAYMVYPTDGDSDLLGTALGAMRRVANEASLNPHR